jgi:hypothetical protein
MVKRWYGNQFVISRALHCWLLLLCRLLGRLTIGCMGRTTACTCASLNQRSLCNLLLPTCHLHSLCEDAPEEGPEGPVRGGGLLLEQYAASHGL